MRPRCRPRAQSAMPIGDFGRPSARRPRPRPRRSGSVSPRRRPSRPRPPAPALAAAALTTASLAASSDDARAAPAPAPTLAAAAPAAPALAASPAAPQPPPGVPALQRMPRLAEIASRAEKARLAALADRPPLRRSRSTWAPGVQAHGQGPPGSLDIFPEPVRSGSEQRYFGTRYSWCKRTRYRSAQIQGNVIDRLVYARVEIVSFPEGGAPHAGAGRLTLDPTRTTHGPVETRRLHTDFTARPRPPF